MLYPHKNEPLSQALFKSPPAQYRGVPFWSWNTKITDELVCEQIAQFSKMGLGGVMIHARTGLETPYMGEEFMRLVKLSEAECKKRNMLTWLYDEDRYPSGAAGGMVTEDIAYRARYLLLTNKPEPCLCQSKAEYDTQYAANQKPQGYYVASYKITLEGGYLTHYETTDQHAKGNIWHAYVRLAEESPWYNGQTYLDTLNKKAVERFIELTHEKYHQAVGEHFGNTIPAIFTDEPQMQAKRPLTFAEESTNASIPWTDDFHETYFQTYNECILDFIPELFWQLPNGQISRARYRFHDHATERFAVAFMDTIGQWCEKHGILSTGHLMSERLLLGQTLAVGEAMRHYRAFQLPGVDVLVGQLELSTIKQAASVAAQDGREGVISELYGVTEWDADFKTYKLQGDWQMALGVTVRNLHLQFMSMEGESKRDWPASIGYQSPWWQYMSYVEDYFGRVALALTRGKAHCKLGVIHPIESYWIHYGPNNQTSAERDGREENFENLLQWLLYGLMDFHFISESLLPAQSLSLGAPLTVGQMEYDTILVPDCKTLRATTVDRLEAFVKAGGRLLFTGKIPTHIDAMPSNRVAELAKKAEYVPTTRRDILEALQPCRVLEIKTNMGKPSDNLFYNMREDGTGRWLFISHVKRRNNRIGKPERYQVRIKGQWRLTQYDAMTGRTGQVICHNRKDGYTHFNLAFYAQDSLLLHLEAASPSPETCVNGPHSVCNCLNLAKQDPLLANTPITIFRPEGYTLAEPTALLLDRPSWRVYEIESDNINNTAWQPPDEILRIDNALRSKLGIPRRQDKIVQPWRLTQEPARHMVELRYTFNSELELTNCKLAIERSQEATIFLNGEHITQPASGWYVDKAIHTIPLPALKKDCNELLIRIPFTARANLEILYILGDFGVTGDLNALTTRPQTIEFGDISRQGLPFYTGNIHYHMHFDMENAGDAIIQVPHYAGAALVFLVNGEEKGIAAYAPHALKIENLPQGRHKLEIVLLGNRYNGFGNLHNANSEYMWYGPDSFRTEGDEWCDRYLLRPIGILSRVEIYA